MKNIKNIIYGELSLEETIGAFKTRIQNLSNELEKNEQNSMWIFVWREYGISRNFISKELKTLLKYENVLIQFVISCPMSYFPKNRKAEHFYHMDLYSRPFFSKPAPLKRKTNNLEVCAYENDLLDPDASSKLVKQGM